jgi:hypothetical protein
MLFMKVGHSASVTKLITYSTLLGVLALGVTGCPWWGAKKQQSVVPAGNTTTNGSATPDKSGETPAANPLVSMENGGFYFPRTGPHAVFVKFGTFHYDPSTKLMTLTGCESDIYRDGKVVLHATAPNAMAAAEGENFRLTMDGAVKAVSQPQGDVLTATNLRWTSQDGNLLAKDVCLTGHGFVHKAASATLSNDLQKASFKQVHSTYKSTGSGV